MELAVSEMEVNVINQITCQLIKKCWFCNKMLDNGSKLLKCLHAICKYCIEKEMNNKRIQCKCLTVTEGILVDCFIEPRNKMCCTITCNTVANQICVDCNDFFCKLCSNVHLDMCDHLLMDFLIKIDSVPCSTCLTKIVDVFCGDCSVMICSVCCLKYHVRHSYKLLENMGEEIQSKLNIQKMDFKEHANNINKKLEVVKKQLKTMDNYNRFINEEIDKTMDMFHKTIDKQTIELKKSIGNHTLVAISNINKNIDMLNSLKQNTSYFMNLTDIILHHCKINDLVNIPKNIIKKIDNFSVHVSSTVLKYDLDNQSDLTFQCNKSLEDFISAIKMVVTTDMLPLLSLSNINSMSTSNISQAAGNYLNSKESKEVKLQKNKRSNADLNDDKNKKQTVYSSKVFNNLTPYQKSLFKNKNLPVVLLDSTVKFNSYFDTEANSSQYLPLDKCVCCTQWTENLIECIHCHRHYHNDCHIPSLPKETTINDPIAKTWKCTMCEDITEYSKMLIEKNTCDFPIGSAEQIIISRILVELYCQNEDSDCLRECPKKEIYPDYYVTITNPISLNDIRNRLISGTSYTSLIEILNDLDKVFENAKLYYHPQDPYHISTVLLQTGFNLMVAKWIPQLAKRDKENGQ